LGEIFQKINWVDLLVVILLIRGSYVGFTKSFGWEFFRFIGYICAILAAIYYYETASRLISDYFPVVSPISNLLSFTGIYLIILLIIKLIDFLIAKIIKIETVSAAGRFGGCLFGFFRGSLLTSLLLISLAFTPIPYFEKSIKDRSYTGGAVLKIAPFLYDKVTLLLPALKAGQRNEALSKSTNLKDGLFVFHSVKGDRAKQKKGLLKGDTEAY